MLVSAKIEGTAQNGTVRGLNVTNLLRQFENRAVRVTVEELPERPGEPGKDQHDNQESNDI